MESSSMRSFPCGFFKFASGWQGSPGRSVHPYISPLYRRIIARGGDRPRLTHLSLGGHCILAALGLERCCYEFSCEWRLSFPWGLHLAGEERGHMVTLSLTFGGKVRLFSKAAAPFFIPTGGEGGVWPPQPRQYPLESGFLLQPS